MAKTENGYRINNPYEIIGNIIKYQHNVKIGNSKSYLCKYIEKALKMEVISEKELIISPTPQSIWGSYGRLKPVKLDILHNNAFNNASVVTSIRELSEVLKESSSTIDNWQKSDIIKRYSTHIAVIINGDFYQYRNNFGWFNYFDLDEIRENIRNSIG